MVAGAAITAGNLIKAAGQQTKTIPWVAIASGIIAIISGISSTINAFSAESKLEEAT